jgi:hypothetical protein
VVLFAGLKFPKKGQAEFDPFLRRGRSPRRPAKAEITAFWADPFKKCLLVAKIRKESA